jgi:hypothetical protein
MAQKLTCSLGSYPRAFEPESTSSRRGRPMEIKHDSADPSASPGMRFFEVNLIAMACGIWEWQVCHDKEAIACGYAATRELGRGLISA